MWLNTLCLNVQRTLLKHSVENIYSDQLKKIRRFSLSFSSTPQIDQNIHVSGTKLEKVYPKGINLQETLKGFS